MKKRKVYLVDFDGIKIVSATKFPNAKATFYEGDDPLEILTWDDELNILVDESLKATKDSRKRITELKRVLTAYTEDFAQVAAGLAIADLDERKERFITAHDELRRLEGKEPRGR
jgi:hypothetical protein